MSDDLSDPPADPQTLPPNPPTPFLKGEPPLCSFCGRGKGEYRQLVTAPKGNICNLCIALAKEQLAK